MYRIFIMAILLIGCTDPVPKYKKGETVKMRVDPFYETSCGPMITLNSYYIERSVIWYSGSIVCDGWNYSKQIPESDIIGRVEKCTE